MKVIKSIILLLMVIQISGCEDKKRIEDLEKKIECQRLESIISNGTIQVDMYQDKLNGLNKKAADWTLTEKELQEGKRVKQEIEKLTQSIDKSKAELQTRSCRDGAKVQPVG